MSDRRKILIIEHDDFLREILGNLLHKQGNYILNGSCIEKGIQEAEGKNIHAVILGTNCRQFQGKQSLEYIRKKLGNTVNFFIINDTNETLDFVADDAQMNIDDLSVQTILERFSQKTY